MEYPTFRTLTNPEQLSAHPFVCVTGDTHADIDWGKLNTKNFPEQNQMNRNDILIIAGDFGGVWEGKNEAGCESRSDRYILNAYERRNFTTVFVDGNHENHVALAEYPVVYFCGARCHQVRPHVYHVMRGEVLHIGGHKIWCMGGAQSHDKEYRIPYKSWWPEEIPTEEEWKHAEETLLREQPDILISHEGPRKVFEDMDMYAFDPNAVTERMDRILDIIRGCNIPVTNWYFGHYHQDKAGTKYGIRFRCLYQTIEAVPREEKQKQQ